MRRTAADEAKARRLANYDRQIEQLERRVDKLIEHRNRFAADFTALGADAHLPEGWNALRAIEDWLVKHGMKPTVFGRRYFCLLYTSPSPRDATLSRMPSSA